MSQWASFFSQNFEDVLLARVFADTPVGCYVDAGCQDEKIESVTKHFHEKGWTGINIDPVQEYIDQYTQSRVKDFNLCCAVGSADGFAELNFVHDSGLSSLDPSRAGFAEEIGLKIGSPRRVQIRTLTSILEEYLPTSKEITFLKIDVEGHELEVLKGLDLLRYRPKVILAETTKPCSTELVDDYPEIASHLAKNYYERVYFDGINTWWLATEEAARKRLFDYPVGIFDGFNPHGIREEILNLQNLLHAYQLQNTSRQRQGLRIKLSSMPLVRSIRHRLNF